MQKSIVVLASLTAACSGAPQQLPPRQAPPREIPSVALPATPIPENSGRVILDTTDVSMHVTVKERRRVTQDGRAPLRGALCTTPCVVDLPLGTYDLFLHPAEATEIVTGDADTFDVQAGLQVYRRAPGHFRTPRPAELILPATLLVIGVAALVPGVVLSATNEGETLPAGLGLLAGGTGLIIGSGIWAFDASRGEIQSGATTSFPLSVGGAPH